MIERVVGCFAVALCFGIMGLIDSFPPGGFLNYGFYIFMILGVVPLILFFIEFKEDLK